MWAGLYRAMSRDNVCLFLYLFIFIYLIICSSIYLIMFSFERIHVLVPFLVLELLLYDLCQYIKILVYTCVITIFSSRTVISWSLSIYQNFIVYMC